MTDLETFLATNSIPEPNSGCYIWEGLISHDGYGRTVEDGPAHRHAYQLAFGVVAKTLHIHHKCQLRCCVNPTHLEALTPSEHKRIHSGDNNKNTCKEGHDLRTCGREVIRYPKGTRIVCCICRAASNRKYRAKLQRNKTTHHPATPDAT